ncbi:glycosyltransferase [Sphingomonas xinjiangensis]|uniref:Glycosyltransferase involved in cell wall biosynthesis n=1 Tax=Sphingomonas xinjiangensis TaxID=643568 RepID=A0A840YDY7_9SPHN|nr:glycosyltransferase [Sphingomonas xinjiangensis]MBB5710199.1 glycosyltransferase involved in cell wall biosynthesis [Sphingomonas xinjiangensis]
MLRVLVLSTLFPDASRPNFGIFVERQTQALAGHGDVDVRVVAPRGIPPWPLSRLPRYAPLAALPAKERWNGLQLYRPVFMNLPGTGGRWHAAEMVRGVTPTLDRIRDEFPFDVIAAEFFFPDGVAAVALGKRYRVPVSIKARGSDIHRWTRKPTIRRQIVAAGCAANGMIAVSEALRDDMAGLGMPRERIRCIVTGVDLSRFAPADRSAAKSALGIQGPLVLSAGALIPLKGHEIVIDAVATLPGTPLWIAGEGPHRPQLERRIARLGVGDRVRLLGSVPHDTVADLLAAADVMALASEREGLANAWTEALASGTPIVVPDVGGARQIVRTPTAGRIVARTAADFAEAIQSLIAAPPHAEAVRATVEPFSWEANSQNLRDFLQALVDGHQRATADGTLAPLPRSISGG